ncbi:hypothetical protein ACIOJE_35125 [Kitasatospora sp. NPDC087861]|uniref:hypothetical protein n=1 Tax=Kitasatospora sp. NPDC087861 TaxID=3364070 RepID=UPI0038245873
MASTPQTADRIARLAEANGWTVTRSGRTPRNGQATHLLHAERGTDVISMSWQRTSTPRGLRWTPSTYTVSISAIVGTASLAEITTIITTPTEPATPISPARIGLCDAPEQAHSQTPGAAVGVRLYHVGDTTGTERDAICAPCAAARTHRPLTDIPAWELTDDDRQTITDTLTEYIQDVRRDAAYGWADSLTWDADPNGPEPHRVPVLFDEWYAAVDHIDPATAYARWRAEQGRPLTADEYQAVGLTAPIDADEPAAADIEEPAGVGPATQYLARALADGLCTLQRVAPRTWQYVIHHELYTVTHSGPHRYDVRHATLSGLHEIATDRVTLQAAAQSARAHARQLQAARA